MYKIIVKKENDRKKEMIEKIKEMLVDSFFGEEWEDELDFIKLYDNAKLEAIYLQEKKSIGNLTAEEVSEVLNLMMDMEQMTMDGIDFLLGRKALLQQIKQQPYKMSENEQNVELFLKCMMNELAMEIYEKVTEYEEAEWIFSQRIFLKELTAFACLKVCVENEKEIGKILTLLKIIFPNREIHTTRVEELLNTVDNFAAFLGSLLIVQADVFDKICCWKNEDVDVTLLGTRFVKKAVQRRTYM